MCGPYCPVVPEDQPRPSYEELVAQNVSLRAGLQQALARIAELEARLAANSSNSSRPPSWTGLAKPAPKQRSLRGKTRRKTGWAAWSHRRNAAAGGRTGP